MEYTRNITVNHRELDKIRLLVANHTCCKVNVFGIITSLNDTNYRYQLSYYVKKRITKPQLATLDAFITGIIATMKSF